MAVPEQGVTPRPAATVMVVRPGERGCEVFMVRRHRASAFAPDQFVFPGGTVRPDDELEPAWRNFLYMPYVHSESALIHKEAVRVCSKAGEQTYDFELRHKAIIDRFGRYPHRNAVLGRQSTPEELEFLKQPGSSF